LKTCDQLHRDIQLTQDLQDMLEDWLLALNITAVRQEQRFFDTREALFLTH
jgi:hypothetical protein